MTRITRCISAAVVCLCSVALLHAALAAPTPDDAAADVSTLDELELNDQLQNVLDEHGFTGDVERSLKDRLGRNVDPALANLGRLLWFDTITGLNDDNSCGGCHSPTNGFGDTQSIAIGIDNNNLVGPNRTGPRNQRRTPSVINNAFFPTLMWNSRFASLARNPFDNSEGFTFPAPEGLTLSYQPHLLTAQAFIPPTERNEVAGFEFPGDNFAIRAEVLNRLNAAPAYRHLFGQQFPEVRLGAPIDFDMFGKAIAEFEFTLVFTNSPLDRFARGIKNSMTPQQKRGALLFFGEAGCVGCHAVSGESNEMFSDFQQHVIGIPQIAPAVTNSVFDGAGSNEDFGLEQVTGDPADRYMFRTSPLRNLAVQAAFFHNGSFTTIESAVRHHLDVPASALAYSPDHLDEDLGGPLGPIEPVLARVDPLLAEPIELTDDEVEQIVVFLRDGLLDPRARPENLMKLIPAEVPSGRPVMVFEDPTALASEDPVASGEEVALPSRRNPGAASRFAHALAQNYPNPFNPSTTIAFTLAAETHVEVTIYDAAGTRIRTLVNERRAGGEYRVPWDGRTDRGVVAASGVYFYRLKTRDVTETRRMVLLR